MYQIHRLMVERRGGLPVRLRKGTAFLLRFRRCGLRGRLLLRCALLRYSIRLGLLCLGGIRRRVEYVMELVGLQDKMRSKPGELSGGELQRAALARILVMEPQVILLDEPTSMLDVISQAQIIHFLKEYQRLHGTAYLFITHNSALAQQVCDRIVDIHAGHIAECPA